ncbi:unnamed protein product [Pylaiella littoralis]
MGRIDTKAKHRRPVSESAAPSRGQRKRALKKASLIKKIGLTKRVERGINEHKDEELPALVAREKTTPIPPPPRVQGTAFRRVVNNKGKKALMNQEMGQLTAVLNTASFQQDPFAAVQAHLRQTACSTPSPVIDDKAQRPGKGKKSTKRVGKHSGEGRGDRRDTKTSAKPFKGRNAKMRVK